MKKVILFDFFGVICSEVAPFWLRRYFDDERADEVKATVVSRVDLGEIGADELFAELGRLVGISPDRVRHEWDEYVRIDQELVSFIEALRERAPIYLLSNAGAELLRPILEEHGLYRLFDGVFISSEMRLAKPSPEYFRAALSCIGCTAEEAIMIDDNPKNIAGAAEAGIDGIVYTSLEALKKQMGEFFL